MSEWRPIETVPVGRLVKLKGAGWEGVGRYNHGSLDLDSMEMGGPGRCAFNDVTHWMPLPESPK